MGLTRKDVPPHLHTRAAASFDPTEQLEAIDLSTQSEQHNHGEFEGEDVEWDGDNPLLPGGIGGSSAVEGEKWTFCVAPQR